MSRRNITIISLVIVGLIAVVIYLAKNSNPNGESVSLEVSPQTSCQISEQSKLDLDSAVKINIIFPLLQNCTDATAQDNANKLINATVESLVSLAKETYKPSGNFNVSYTSEYLSDKLFSLMLKGNVLTAAGQTLSTFYPINFDLVRSQNLKLSDLQANTDLIDQISSYTITNLKLQLANQGLDSTIEVVANAKPENFQLFSIAPTGLKLTFLNNQLFSGNSAALEVFVPWAQIRGNLNSQFKALVGI